LNAICSASPDDAGSVGTYNETDVGSAAFHSASISARVGMSVYSVIAAPFQALLTNPWGSRSAVEGDTPRSVWVSGLSKVSNRRAESGVRNARLWGGLLGVERTVIEASSSMRTPGWWSRGMTGEGRRRWRALDLGTVQAVLEADAPRVRCASMGWWGRCRGRGTAPAIPGSSMIPACIHSAVKAYAKTACFKDGIQPRDRPNASCGSETLVSGCSDGSLPASDISEWSRQATGTDPQHTNRTGKSLANGGGRLLAMRQAGHIPGLACWFVAGSTARLAGCSHP
jgi:hypothetical protein